ncbi:DUF3298 and DUF4163 domain-containing protein [Bacillus badius]|uniref:Anti-sigma factor yrhM n=1 Tax=Bacillus badius TaxID=1455 RepID=A0ABR5AR74_BACBA|nr:RsiV family protein [Bacillus badius]KIL73768.1 anti-sigma factor yrhM [Bacillus badius]KIL77246.1 anti-sigma factor yrhM [Bacillus badius]KZO01087.1 anti-sigma factor [Bacillus badius]KZR59532.1 anti-sigma factor [Bacillus badius]MED4717607.1 RsiV family protein [Bacillus badius]
MDKRLEMLRKDYKDIPIPKELDRIVAQALQEKPKKKTRPVWPASVAAAALLFTATVNFSPEAAQAMSKIPLVKELVEVVTFNEFKEEKGNASIDVKTPAITGLDNQALEDNLNQKYVEESQKLYEEFAKSAAAENGHFSMNSEYEKVTESPEILSVRRTIQRTQASGYIQNRYVTIDKENEVLITLKGLFKNGQYVPVISENIKEQMKQQMAADPNKIYWVSENEIEPFTQISPDQPFYINQDHKLVISFDEYEAAPGYMGPVEFIIPTAVISDLLVGERYIR